MYGIDLEGCGKSWRWFRTRLSYLLSIDGPLRNVISPPPETDTPMPAWTD